MRLVVLASAVFAVASACASIEPAPQATKPAPEQKPEPKPFAIDGYYAEACSCGTPCPCELTGPIMSCKGVGAYVFTQGSYGGEDFSGTRLAYSLYIGQQVRLYIDAPDAAKRAAAERFARVALAAFGPIQSAREAKVELTGKDGAYTIRVDGGKVMQCTTEPMLGGDRKTPIVHSNTFDALNPVMYQAQCTGCSYSDGEMKIELEKGRNSYFNAHMHASGKL